MKFTTKQIIEQFEKIHGDYYNYSLVEYKNDSSKVKIICPKHGIFEQQVAAHKRQKQGCPKCGNIKKGQEITGNKKFIERIEIIFGKDKFDYSLLNYKGAHSNIKLICNNCNNIEDKPPSVWYKGFGCLKCQGNKIGKKQYTTEKFIESALKVHSIKYDYSKVKYTGTKNKVEIICPKHGSFFQVANVHINSKSGCPKCKTSKGEEEIGIWLNKNNINYKFQYQVNIWNSNHYYDFYLPDHNIIIEFNGMQHYKPVKFFGGQEGFKYLQERDKIKEQYCKDNNIKLIIISYKDNIEKILNKLS